MRINWNEEICGIPLLRIRHLLRQAGNEQFTAAFVADVLRISQKKSHTLVDELVARGWLERAKTQSHDRSQTVYFETTVAGNAFKISRAIQRIPRARAELILKGFLERVRTVNSDDDFGWYVVEVRIFGSYLDERFENLGDIDLGIEYATRPIIGRNIATYSEERAKLSGRVSLSWFQKLTFVQHEVRQILKARSPYLSLHTLEDIRDIKAKSELLYRAPKKDAKPRHHRGHPSRA